jgi:pyruvate/2-oxoglutarate dehydrogenase complex dihydrolipoamide dehydrogenase (E3) component
MAPRNVNLHPDNHQPDDLQSDTFDVIVIGSGPVGRQVASKTQAGGLSSLIIEEELWGGDCPFWACMPSKAILRPGEALAAGRQVGGARQLISGDRLVDVQGVFERRDKITHNWEDDFFVNLSLKQKCSVVRGKGSIIGEKTVLVKNVNGQERTLTANQAVVIATGSEPVVLSGIKGIDDIEYWTPREATSANTVPDHLIIIGSGVVGCEMATAFSTYGSKVSMISATREVLARFEPEAGKMVREELKSRGVEFYLSTKVIEVSKQSDGNIRAQLASGETVVGSTVLVAAGRKPRTSGIGLDTIGIDSNIRLPVDASMLATSASGEWLYAVGDANMRAALTHMGEYQGRVAAGAIIARAKGLNVSSKMSQPWTEFTATADVDAISQVVVTDPHVACVGLTLADAQRRGINAIEVAVNFQFPGAWVYAEFDYEGWAQWVIDADKDVLVGATFVGREAGDLLHGSTIAVVGQVPLDRLKHAVPSFPTRSEVYLQLLEKWYSMQR